MSILVWFQFFACIFVCCVGMGTVCLLFSCTGVGVEKLTLSVEKLTLGVEKLTLGVEKLTLGVFPSLNRSPSCVLRQDFLLELRAL